MCIAFKKKKKSLYTRLNNEMCDNIMEKEYGKKILTLYNCAIMAVVFPALPHPILKTIHLWLYQHLEPSHS